MDFFDDFDFDDDLNLNNIDSNDTSTKPSLLSRTPTTAQSSEPTNSFIDTTSKEPETKKAKKKRLDADLLLSSEGLPRLMSEATFLSFQGPGHEEQNLKKLMRYYQLWANSLFPKFRFTDFAQRVGTAASHKSVKERISIWQDEYRDRHQVRADMLAENQSSDEGEEEEDEDAFNQLLLDSVFPVASNKKDEVSSEAKRFERPEDLEDSEEPIMPPVTRKRRLICLDSDEEDDDEEEQKKDVEKIQQSFADSAETDIDLSDIPLIPDTHMEDIGSVSS